MIIDYFRKYETVVIAITVDEELIDAVYFIDMSDLKKHFLKMSPVGEIRFLEQNREKIAKL